MKKAKLIGALTAILLGLVVILQNTQPVEVRFLLFKVAMPNAILLGLALLVGTAIGLLAALMMPVKRHPQKEL